MNTRRPLSLILVLSIVVAPAILSVTLPAAGAQIPESGRGIAAQDAVSMAASLRGARFVHTATADNTVGTTTYIDHYLANENPNAIVFVTQNRNPGGVGDTSNSHPIGVSYDGTLQKWGIINEDLENMPDGAAFNVLIPPVWGPNTFVHTATPTNTHTPTPTSTHTPTATPTATLLPGTGAVRACAWEDLNGDGVQDAGEPALMGLAMQLDDDAGQLLGTCTTQPDGCCQFSELDAGSYTVTLGSVPGFFFTTERSEDVEVMQDQHSHVSFGMRLYDRIYLPVAFRD